MNRPMPSFGWLELAVVAVLTIAWMLWRPRPPWAGDGNIWRRKR